MPTAEDLKSVAPSGNFPGLAGSVYKALSPVSMLDDQWSLEEMVLKVVEILHTIGEKYNRDERLKQRASALQIRALIDEFVEDAMDALCGACFEKAWYAEADFSIPLFAVVSCLLKLEFKIGKPLCRTMTYLLPHHVEDALARYREEERVQKVLWDAIGISGLPEEYQNTAWRCLRQGYDEAHMGASYGTCEGESLGRGLVMDFTKRWMQEFVTRGADVLRRGVGEAREERFAFLTTVFQYLIDPEQCCLPRDLVAQSDDAPPENWSFVETSALALVNCAEADAASEDADGTSGGPKRRRVEAGQGSGSPEW